MQFRSSDRNLAARLERAEAANGIAMAKAVLNTVPTAAFESFAGGTAVFAGSDSPMTHALGIGLAGPVPESELERMESFFQSRNSDCLVDLCPLADPGVIHFFQTRPYRVIEFNHVLARRITPEDCFIETPQLRRVEPEEMLDWTRMIGEGFSEGGEVGEELTRVMSATLSGSLCWTSGEGGGAMGIQDNVALFYGDSVLPRARGKGLQQALIQARLGEAQRAGCDLAMVSVIPGSSSHRNYERAGFELVYMRVNLARDFGRKN